MQKPEFMQIRLPVEKKHFNPAVKKFIKSLTLQILEIQFSQKRNRKDFKYKVIFTEPVEYQDWRGKEKERIFSIHIVKE